MVAAALTLSFALAAGGAQVWAARRAARVWVLPQSSIVQVGAAVTVAIKIRDARNVGSVPFTLQYDPSILELVSSSPMEGSFLRRDGSPTSFLAKAASPAGGGGVVVGLSRLGGGRGARGQGILCTLTFRARSAGVTPLAFSRASVMDPSAQPLEARFEAATITVRGSP